MATHTQLQAGFDDGLNDQIRKLYNVLQTNLATTPETQRARAFDAFMQGLRNAVEIHDELTRRLGDFPEKLSTDRRRT